MKCSRIVALLGILALIVSANDVMAQQGGGRGRGGRGGFGGRGQGKAGLLQNADVRKSLELSDDQVADLESIGKEMQEQTREMFSGFRDLSPEDRRTKFTEMREKMQEMQKKAETRIKDDILLKDQWKRLSQIDLQMNMSRRGTVGALSSGAIADALGLSDEQKKALQEKSQEAQKELQEKITKLREEARKEILSILTTEQKSKLEELMGDKFEVPQSLRGGGFGGRGRGRTGGNGGRNGGGRGRGGANRPARPAFE